MYDKHCVSAIRCNTGSVPVLGPANSVLSHAYSGNNPKSRSVVRARDIRPAKAARGGTAPSASVVVVEGFKDEGLMMERSFRAKADSWGDFVCRYAAT